MKKKGMSNSSKKIIIIMAILVILFIGLIVALFNIFEKDKVKQEPQYRKGEQQENIKRDGTQNYTERMKTSLVINSPEINAVLRNPNIKGTELGRLTSVVGDELSFNNGKFRIQESFRKSNVYVFK